MRLRKAQKEIVLQGIAEGLTTGEINKRAAKFKPRFKVSRSQVDFYRKTREIKLDEIKEAGETQALTHGLAIKDERVAVLQRLANRMIADLLPSELDDSLLWTKEAKTVANKKYSYLEFNKSEVDALRGVLDDIAAEVGERVRKNELTGKDGKPLATAFVNLYVPDNGRDKT